MAKEFEGRIYLLPANKEKYISFTKYIDNTTVKLEFIDFSRVMLTSLEKLSSCLENEDKKITRQYCKNYIIMKLNYYFGKEYFSINRYICKFQRKMFFYII